MKNCFTILVCPQCKSTLAITNQGLYCPLHDKYYAFQDKFLRFSSPTYSWGIKWIKDVSTINSIEELKSLVFRSDRSTYPWTFSRRRSDFLYLLSKLTFSEVNTFLDAGAGLGNIITSISHKAKCAYALDASYENVLFIKKLSEIEGNHIVPILSNLSSLPFANSIDVALMNGVLEWVGISEKEFKDVEMAQLSILNNIRNALGPRGTLIIGIENRFNPFYLLERDHQGLFWTSFLPRKIANFASKLLQGKEYRTYTYDYWRYLRLLTRAGFKDIRIFGCFPDYRFPQFTYSLEDERSLKFISSRKHLNSVKGYVFFNVISANLGLARLLSPSFIIFAFKNHIDQKATFTGHLAIGGWGNFAKIIDLDKGQVVSVLRDAKLREILFRNIKNRPRHKITSKPKMVDYNGEFGYTIEKLVDGESLSSISKKDKVKMLNLLKKAFDELSDFYHSQKQSIITLSQYYANLMDDFYKYKKRSFLKPYEDELDELVNINLNKKAKESIMPIVYVHGDLHPSNILYSKSINEILFIDWEYGRKACIFHDILYFISQYASDNKKDHFLRDIFAGCESGDDLERLLVDTLDQYLESAHLDKKVLRDIYSIFLLECLIFLFETGSNTSFDAYREYDFLLWVNRALKSSSNMDNKWSANS